MNVITQEIPGGVITFDENVLVTGQSVSIAFQHSDAIVVNKGEIRVPNRTSALIGGSEFRNSGRLRVAAESEFWVSPQIIDPETVLDSDTE